METAAECYAMADHCEKQAAEVVSPEARRIFQEVAVKWRALGDSLKAEEGTTRRIVPGCTEQQLKTLLAIYHGRIAYPSTAQTIGAASALAAKSA